jgi:hypothetical protein
MMNAKNDYSINFTNHKAPAVVVAAAAGVADHMMLKIPLPLQHATTVVAVTAPTSVAAAAADAAVTAAADDDDECLKPTLAHTKSRTKLQKQMSA